MELSFLRADPTAGVNPAARANVERVFREEQERMLRMMAGVRLLFAGLGVLAVVPFAITGQHPGMRSIAASVTGACVYLVVALLLFGAVAVRGHAGRWAAFTVALVDVPLIAGTQYVQQGYAQDPVLGVPTNIAVMFAFVALAALSMSRAAIAWTAAAAMVGMVPVLVRGGVANAPLAICLVGLVGTCAGCVVLVTRMRGLVVLARKRDLLGKYILGERLGAGGMAEVFRATYSPEGGFERKVALKRILPSFAENPDAVRLFRREAELGATLAHPNIVQVLDFGSDGDSYFIAMEFIDGLPLNKVLSHLSQRGEALPIPAAVYLASCLAAALEAIHERASPTGDRLTLVHRDVNPPNVMVSRIGEVKLADFGIARGLDADRMTRTGTFRGKLGYAAPEQLAGGAFDARADLFALGLTVYEALTGRRMFPPGSEAETLQQLLASGPLPRAAQGRPEIAADLDAAVDGLLQRDPAARTARAAAFRDQLHALARAEWRDAELGRRQLAAAVARALAAPGPAALAALTAGPTPETGQEPTRTASSPGPGEEETRTATQARPPRA